VCWNGMGGGVENDSSPPKPNLTPTQNQQSNILLTPAHSEPVFTPSTVWTSGQERLDPSVRLSHKAAVPRSHTVRCIEERARAFQGWRPYVFVEKLWAQKYGPGGHYTYHYDWSSASPWAGRVSSFMVWLGDECEGGGTKFPRLQMSKTGEWCRFIECGEGEGGGDKDDEEAGKGVTFKPIKGNAVFWENIRSDGTGYEESWHAGLPVTKGTKIGLNIWSWYQEGYEPGKADEEAAKEE
jgi:prolyl 4-hydroxylase